LSVKKQFFIAIVGLGSIGKRHADYFSTVAKEMIFIDPSEQVAIWAREERKNKFRIFKNIKDAKAFIDRVKLPKMAVISNLGHQHYSSMIELYKIGFKNFFIEKPVVNALYQINQLSKMGIDKKVKIVAGFGWRYSQLPEKIIDISQSYLGGLPILIDMTGGAFGVVTNGIHFIDLAVSIFNTNPISVISD